MVAKLVFGLLVLAFVLSVAVTAAYLYFREQAALEHEKEMKQMEQTEKLFEKE